MDGVGLAPGTTRCQKIQETVKLLSSCCPGPTLQQDPPWGKCPTSRLKAAKIRCLQMGKCRIRELRQSARAPHPWISLPTTHSALHAAPSERKYKKPLVALALGLVGCGPAKALSFPSTDTGTAPDVFVSPLLPRRTGSVTAAGPAPGTRAAGGMDPCPRRAAPLAAACLLPGSLPAVLAPGLGTGMGSQT